MAILSPENALSPKVALSTNTDITNGSHILYITSDLDEYIDNAVCFLSTGLRLAQGILFVENNQVFNLIQKRLYQKGFKKEQIDSIVFAEHQEFYMGNEVMNVETVLSSFTNSLAPFVKKGIPIRTWGKVNWLGEQSCLLDKLKEYETAADQFINHTNAFSVCAYDGNELPASIHMELMKTHQYIMSDTELVASSFYNNKQIYPAIKVEEDYVETIAKLHGIHSHYAQFIEKMPEAVCITSSSTIVYANDSALKLMECERQELIGKKLAEVLHPPYDISIKNRERQLHKGAEPILIQQNIKTLNGNLVEAEVTSFPFVFEDFKETIISIVRDTRERKENQNLAIKNEKLGITGQLAASIAHEIRNPLTSIKGFMKLAQEGSIGVDMFSIIDNEINRIEIIASELMVLGKPVTVEMKRSNVNNLLQTVYMLMESQANMDNVMINFEASDEDFYIECNEQQIKQVFINLIKNAIEALPTGGRITLQISDILEFVTIQIIDNGKGIPDHIKNKLGEPFYTTKEKGTGLGLMVCYNIIEQHKGEIDFISTEGEGTTFTINLPLAN